MERKDVSKAVLKRLPGYLSYLKSHQDGASTHISATYKADCNNKQETKRSTSQDHQHIKGWHRDQGT